MITEIEDYFSKGCGRCKRFETPSCSVKTWELGLQKLRDICRSSGLTETVKWCHPCYMHNGRNILLFGALKGDFRVSFFNAALMKDQAGVLVKRGPNTQNADMICFSDNAEVAKMETLLKDYIAEAVSYADAGVKPVKKKVAIELPVELVDALDSDPELADAFHALTPGRQRSYVINLNGAKATATKNARIAKFRDKIIAGKGALER